MRWDLRVRGAAAPFKFMVKQKIAKAKQDESIDLHEPPTTYLCKVYRTVSQYCRQRYKKYSTSIRKETEARSGPDPPQP